MILINKAAEYGRKETEGGRFGRRKLSAAAGCLAAAVCAAFLLLTGCGGRAAGPTEYPTAGPDTAGRLKVAATLFPYYDFTRQIAGDLVDLELVIPAGMDSHSFEPTPAHMRTIQEADILICNGGSMEQWVSQVLDAVDTSSMTVVTMMDHVDAVEEEIVEGMEEDGHDHEAEEGPHSRESGIDRAGDRAPRGQESSIDRAGEKASHDTDAVEYDEHIWTSPVNAMKFAEVIAEALAEADPAHREEYMAGKEAYQKELLQVHEGFLQVTAEKKRNMIVVADKFPFRYLAEEYGFDYRAAFSGCSTDTEPSARTIAYLIDQVRQRQIPAVYYLELSTSRVAEIISGETGAQPLLLHSCHNVTRAELEGGITYVELMKGNVENLRKGLVE